MSRTIGRPTSTKNAVRRIKIWETVILRENEDIQGFERGSGR